MRLTQNQIDTIIEGLENPNTRLESTHTQTGYMTNTIRKLKNGKYRNTVSKKLRGWFNECNIKFKSDILKVLQEREYYSFEIITTNEDKSETRTKI